MLRSALVAAILVLPTPSMADKIVNPDGDSFIEIPSQSKTASSIVDSLSPVTSAEAASAATQTAAPRPAADVPQMQGDGSEIDLMLKPDYSAESFR